MASGDDVQPVVAGPAGEPIGSVRAERDIAARPGDDHVPPAEGAATAGQRFGRRIDILASDPTACGR
jgi:hypothetical protein